MLSIYCIADAERSMEQAVFKAKFTSAFLVALLLMCMPLAVHIVWAADDPAFFVISKDAPYFGGSGWYAGYVVAGQSGTYKLNISATGLKELFPIGKVKIIVAISAKAQSGGLSLLSIEETKITKFTEGIPSYYGTHGGPFDEPDYYGYNDEYVIPELTYEEGHYPEGWYQVTLTVNFAPDATEDSKVMLFCYGEDSKGNPVETPFKQATLFVVPEYVTPLMGVVSCFAAYAVFRKRALVTQRKNATASASS
jgi:hypothetical protein